MIKNRYLKSWIEENYPLMDTSNKDELAELDYTDLEKFANAIVSQLNECQKELRDAMDYIDDQHDELRFYNRG